MNMPQEEEKRYQIGAETHEVLSSKRALNSSSSFPNTPFTRTNAGRPPDRKCIRYMFSMISKEHMEDGETRRRLGNAIFNAGYVNKCREAERNVRLPGRVLVDFAQGRGDQADYPAVQSNGTSTQSAPDAAAPDSSLHASPIAFWQIEEAPPDLMRFRQSYRCATQDQRFEQDAVQRNGSLKRESPSSKTADFPLFS